MDSVMGQQDFFQQHGQRQQQNFFYQYGQQQQQQYPAQTYDYPVQQSAGQIYQASHQGYPTGTHLGASHYQNYGYQAGPMAAVGGQQKAMGMNQYHQQSNQISGPYSQYQGQQYSAPAPQQFSAPALQGYQAQAKASQYYTAGQYASSQGMQTQHAATPYVQQLPQYAVPPPAAVQANRGHYQAPIQRPAPQVQYNSQAPIQRPAPQVQYNRNSSPQVFSPAVASVAAPVAAPAVFSQAVLSPTPAAEQQQLLPSASPESASTTPARESPATTPAPTYSSPATSSSSIARPKPARNPRKRITTPAAPKPSSDEALRRRARAAARNPAVLPVTQGSQATCIYATRRRRHDWEAKTLPVAPTPREVIAKRRRESSATDEESAHPAKMQKLDSVIDLTENEVAPPPVNPNKEYAPRDYKMLSARPLPAAYHSAAATKRATKAHKMKARLDKARAEAERQTEEEKVRRAAEADAKKKEQQKKYRLKMKAKKEAEKRDAEAKKEQKKINNLARELEAQMMSPDEEPLDEYAAALAKEMEEEFEAQLQPDESSIEQAAAPDLDKDLENAWDNVFGDDENEVENEIEEEKEEEEEEDDDSGDLVIEFGEGPEKYESVEPEVQTEATEGDQEQYQAAQAEFAEGQVEEEPARYVRGESIESEEE